MRALRLCGPVDVGQVSIYLAGLDEANGTASTSNAKHQQQDRSTLRTSSTS